MLVGTLLGWIAWEMSRASQSAAMYNGVMALVMVTAGSASFVLHALHTQRRIVIGHAATAARVRQWVFLLGLGLVLSMSGLNVRLA